MWGWTITAAVVVAVSSLIWWSSGRARPDLRRRSIDTQIGVVQGRAGMYDSGGDGGPTPGGGSF